MKTVDKVVWGVIGAGSVCEVKSVPGMYKVAHSEVKTVMRRNAEKGADFVRRHRIPHSTTNVDDIFNDPDINIVYIGTPPDTHCEYTLKAAAAGKAVYVEKPMALHAASAQLMMNAAQKGGVKLSVAHLVLICELTLWCLEKRIWNRLPEMLGSHLKGSTW